MLRHPGGVKVFLGWAAMVAVSVLLGLALYSTSLQGTGTGYTEVAVTPRPAQTVIKTKTKVVRKPPKVVYVPQAPVSSGGGTAVDNEAYIPPAPAVTRAPAFTTDRIASGGSSSSHDSSSDDHSDDHDDDHDDD